MCPVRETPPLLPPVTAFSHLPLSFAGHPEPRQRTPRAKQLQLRGFGRVSVRVTQKPRADTPAVVSTNRENASAEQL